MHDESDIPITVTIDADSAGQRLDKTISLKLTSLQISRARVQKLIEDGHIVKAGAPKGQLTAKQIVKAGDQFDIHLPPPVDADPEGEDIPIDIVFEDAHILVVNKPPGMVVHPAPGSPSGTLVNALLYHCGDSLSGIGGVRRPGIVHRIDKDTSGLLAIAKSDAAHHGLATQFADHSIDRHYDALCWGSPDSAAGHIEGAIGRHPVDRKRMTLRSDGKWARTHYRVMADYMAAGRAFAAHIRCQLETGRTHQVRVHMAHIHHSLIGDPVYGKPRPLPRASGPDMAHLQKTLGHFHRQALHARSLGFDHPVTSQRLYFERECPDDMKWLLAALAPFRQ